MGPLRQRPVGRPPSRAVTLSIGFLGLAAVLAVLYVAFTAADRIPGRSHYTLYARFENADNLANHSQVRLAGRLVGQVLDPRVVDGMAEVELQLDADLEPLRADTTLRVRPRSVLGVRYLDLTPGSRGRPLADGETIPAGRTSAAVSPDEVLGILDPRTREATRTLLRELGPAVAGRGEDVGEALAAGPELLDDAGATAAAVSARPGALRGLIRGARAAAGAAEPVRDEIAEGFAPEARALRPLSNHGGRLEEALDRAPATLRVLEATLARVDPLLDEVGAFARRARPALRAAPRALAQTEGLLREGRPGLRRAPRTLRLARRASPPTVDALRRLQPSLPALDDVLLDATPVLEELGPRRCDLLAAFGNFADVLSFGNRAGNVLRFSMVGPSLEMLGGATAATRVRSGFHQNPYPRPCEAPTDRVRR